MSEKPPEEEGQDELDVRLDKISMEFQRQDREDPERGPIVQLVRTVRKEAFKDKESPLFNEFISFRDSFIKHFGAKGVYPYRLYHHMIFSSPPAGAELFDVVDPEDSEEKWSIAAAMRKLAEKYHIDTGAV